MRALQVLCDELAGILCELNGVYNRLFRIAGILTVEIDEERVCITIDDLSTSWACVNRYTCLTRFPRSKSVCPLHVMTSFEVSPRQLFESVFACIQRLDVLDFLSV